MPRTQFAAQAQKVVQLVGVARGAEKVALHPDCTKFENDDALFALCEVLESWFKKVGKHMIEDAEEQASDDRFQRIGTQVMPYAELLLRQSQFQSVAEQITIGTIGDGHTKVPRKLIIGPDEGKSLAVGGNPFEEKGKHKPSGGKAPVCPPDPKKDHPLHTPSIVYGDKGRKRTEVKGSSTGLRFEYIEMDDIRVPFDFEPTTGCLSFNVRNANWGLCQESDAFLQEYHMAVITTALTAELYRSSGGVNHDVKRFAFDNLMHQVFAIRNGKALIAKH